MKNIDHILEKYFEGETSLDEEKLLRQYFQSNRVEAKHLIYAPIFGYMAQENTRLTALPSADRPTKPRRLALWASAAACAAMLLGALYFVVPQADTSNISYVYVDGKKQKDAEQINAQALYSLMAIEEDDADNDILESQIDILDSFIDME